LISEISSTVLEIKELLHSIRSTNGTADIAGIVDDVKEIRNYAESVHEDFK